MSLPINESNIIEERPAKTAAEFWSLLSPESPLFPDTCHLLYRGQCKAAWGLIPSVLRESELAVKPYFDERGKTPSGFQIYKEWYYLVLFVSKCDEIGLRVPNDSPAFRNTYLNENGSRAIEKWLQKPFFWPDPVYYELLALAQHHGIPTRLLDWSTRSHVAAYFAISDAIRSARDGAERLAVWVLDMSKRDLFPELETVRVPGSNNSNIAAQAGIFTMLRQNSSPTEPFTDPASLDQYFQQKNLPAPLIKVTLPVSEAEAALKLCGLYGISGATLFPDYYGVARAAKDLMRTATFQVRYADDR